MSEQGLPTPGVWMHSYSAPKRSARNAVPVPNRAGIELSVLQQMEKVSVLTVIVLEGTDAPARCTRGRFAVYPVSGRENGH